MDVVSAPSERRRVVNGVFVAAWMRAGERRTREDHPVLLWAWLRQASRRTETRLLCDSVALR